MGLLKLYKSRGIDINPKSEQRVFFKLYTNKHDADSWYTDKAMVDRLDAAMKEIGLYQKLEKEMPPRRITPNSSRHYVATYKKVNENWSWDDIALFLGHDTEQTQKRYSKATSSMLSARKDKKSGIDSMDTFKFIDSNDPKDEEKNQRLRKQYTEMLLNNPETVQGDIKDGKLDLKIHDNRIEMQEFFDELEEKGILIKKETHNADSGN